MDLNHGTHSLNDMLCKVHNMDVVTSAHSIWASPRDLAAAV